MRNGSLARWRGATAPLSGARVALLTLLLLLSAIVLSIFVSATNQAWFGLLNRFLGLERPLARALLFSSYLLFLALLFEFWGHAAFGLHCGETARYPRLILVVTVGYMLATALAVTLVGGSTPYSGATVENFLVEVLIVPVREELLYRGVVLSAMFAALRRWHPLRRATWLAVLIGAIAFGTAHLANAAGLPLAFVVPQAHGAVMLGLGCGGLMLRCRSVYPAILLHAAVNLVVVLL